MTRTKQMWIAVVTLGVAAAGVAATSREKAGSAAVAQPGVAREGKFVLAAGLVEPDGEEVKIGSELDGKLARVVVEEGEAVKRGQTIAVLENGDYRARVALSEAALRESEAVLDKLRNGSRAEDRREAQALLREAEAHFETAQAEAERRRVLLDRGAVSRSEHDLAARDASAARARVDAARERVNVAMDQTRPEDLRRAEAEVASARARRDEAAALLAKTYLRSPLDGRILRKFKKTGESVTASGDSPVVSLGDTKTLVVRVDVDETDVAKLRIGQPAWVRADAYGDARFTGHVIRIGQALGRKNIRTDEPTERVDTKVLETLVQLDPGQTLPIGLRVDAYLEKN
jgi:ABC exporter DevB family membrane fusion protein